MEMIRYEREVHELDLPAGEEALKVVSLFIKIECAVFLKERAVILVVGELMGELQEQDQEQKSYPIAVIEKDKLLMIAPVVEVIVLARYTFFFAQHYISLVKDLNLVNIGC